MQLTRAADYAIRVMIHLAVLPPGTRMSRSELATAAECPEQFLCKVLQSLTRAGLLTSHRGNVGGFELETPYRNTSILEIVEAIEGPIHLNVCLNCDHRCDRLNSCPAHTVWADAQLALTSVLGKARIGDLAAKVSRTPEPELATIEPLT
jgi:Rrf2 family protein